MNYKKIIRSIFKVPFMEQLIKKHAVNKIYGKGFTKFIALHTEYTSPAIRNCNRNGINYSLDITNLVDWYIYFGFRETEKARLFSQIKSGQTILDVGANIGDMTLNFAKLVGENGKVISFEPFPPMFQKLERNVSMNLFENIQLYNLGLANTSSKLGMEEPSAGNPGMNRITAISEKQTTQITVVRYDDFLKEQNLQALDLIKIDVEGFELEVLLGGNETILKFKPTLFIELDDDNLKAQGSSANMLVKHLLHIGYRIENVTNSVNIDEKTNFQHCHFDIICMHPENIIH